MILSATGTPLPPTAVEAELRRISPTLGMVWIPPDKALFPKGAWAISAKWPKTDPRHRLIQRGDMRPGTDHDTIAYLPDDCPPEQAAGYVRQKFVRWNASKQSARQLIDRLADENAKVQQEAMKPVEEFAEELVKTNAGTLFREQGKRIPKVFVTDQRHLATKKGKEL